MEVLALIAQNLNRHYCVLRHGESLSCRKCRIYKRDGRDQRIGELWLLSAKQCIDLYPQLEEADG